MPGGKPVQRFQPVEEGDLQTAPGGADLGNVEQIHPLDLRHAALLGEHQPDGVGHRAEGQLAVSLLHGRLPPAAAQRRFNLFEILPGRGGFQQPDGLPLFFGRLPAARRGRFGIARKRVPVAKNLLPGVEVVRLFLHGLKHSFH